MIVVDTSALMAIVMGEPDGRRSFDALIAADGTAISAGGIKGTPPLFISRLL